MQLKKHIKRQQRASRIAHARETLARNPSDLCAIAALVKLEGNAAPATEEHDDE